MIEDDILYLNCGLSFYKRESLYKIVHLDVKQ